MTDYIPLHGAMVDPDMYQFLRCLMLSSVNDSWFRDEQPRLVIGRSPRAFSLCALLRARARGTMVSSELTLHHD